MLNYLVLVGKIVKKEKDAFKIKVLKSDKKVYNNDDADIFDVDISETMMAKVQDFCSIGDTVGIKGKIFKEDDIIKIFAEKVTFLSSGKGEK